MARALPPLPAKLQRSPVSTARVAMKCNECYEVDGEAVLGAVFRCTDCNELMSRLQRMFKKPGLSRTEVAFNAMSKDERAEFFREEHASMGRGLAAIVEALVASKTTTTSTVSLKGTGAFLEEADLREKYAKKPEQLEAILRNTRPVYDPIRETTLYEDMKYVSGFEDNEEESKASGSAIIQEGRLKPKKAAKKEPKKPKIAKGEVAPDAQPGPHQISHAQASSLHKFLDIFTTMQYELAAGLQVIDDSKLQEYVVAATFKNVTIFVLRLQDFIAMLELSLETKTDYYNEMKGIESTLKVAGKELVKNMRLQIKTANLLKAGPKDKGKKRKVEVCGEQDSVP